MSHPMRVFDDPHGDPFFTYVEMGGKWYRIDEAAVIEMEEQTMREVGECLLARLERRWPLAGVGDEKETKE